MLCTSSECFHRQSRFAAMQGLDVIHGCGLIHGDIKPNNFRLDRKPDGSQVHLVITDLGTSCAVGSGGRHPDASLHQYLHSDLLHAHHTAMPSCGWQMYALLQGNVA